MAPDPRNPLLDSEESDQESEAYNSEEEQLQKGGRNPKRRKLERATPSQQTQAEDDEDKSDVESDDDDDDDDAHSATPPSQEPPVTKPASNPKQQVKDEDEEGDDDENPHKDSDDRPTQKSTKVQKATEAANLKARKSGIIYLSRIPPFMKPNKLRHLLEPYGALNRMYLRPEDPSPRANRVKNGGKKKARFAEGWVEFVKKSDAKKAVDFLNSRQIGGKKGNFYYDQIWTMLYLKGYKWHHLMEQMAAEDKEREVRMRGEIEKKRNVNEAFEKNLDQSKMVKNMEKKRKRAGREDDGEGGRREDRDTDPAAALKKRKDSVTTTGMKTLAGIF